MTDGEVQQQGKEPVAIMEELIIGFTNKSACYLVFVRKNHSYYSNN
jgi:hypothetical protein